MRALGLVVLFAARAGAAPASDAAAPAPYAVPAPGAAEEVWRVPDRYDLPGTAGAWEKVSPAVAALGSKALLKLLRDPKDARHAEGAVELASRTRRKTDGKNKKYSWRPTSDAAEAIDFLLEEGAPLKFRRWAVYRLFSSAEAEVAGRITLDPEDREADAWWARLDALRLRGRRDVDPRLAEFFERYAEDPEAARWPDAKRAAGAARDRLLAARPELRDFLAEVWGLQENIEKNQLIVLGRFQEHLGGRKDVPAARREKLKAREKSTMDHRLRIGWANMVPRIIHERLGAAEARAHGFEPVPVRLGWARIPPR